MYFLGYGSDLARPIDLQYEFGLLSGVEVMVPLPRAVCPMHALRAGPKTPQYRASYLQTWQYT